MGAELVFTVISDKAQPATPTTLEKAGLREREHLQEWVLANPEILGTGVVIITCEFDRWQSKAGAEKDRLDILALDSDGHLVVAELKRDAAPDTVEMQAIKYAAMASRFTQETLVDAYVEFQRKQFDTVLSNEEAADVLFTPLAMPITEETLRAPRIVLVAGSFPVNVTATSVWLSEMGLDITLVRVQAYETATGIVITVSQHYPPPGVEDFVVQPARAARARSTVEAPVVAWTEADLTRVRVEVTSATIQMTMDLCSERPGEWVPAHEIRAATGRDPMQHRGDYGGFGITLRNRFKRSNAPFEYKWSALGTNEVGYRVTPEIAEMWRTLSATSGQIAPLERGEQESESATF